jgi:predicted transcriptional regulator
MIMRRTWLEMQADVLKVLAQNGSLKISHIMNQVNINCHVLKQCLDFLIHQNLVEKQALSKKRSVYAITERGRTILNTSGRKNDSKRN